MYSNRLIYFTKTLRSSYTAPRRTRAWSSNEMLVAEAAVMPFATKRICHATHDAVTSFCSK